ncbi:MAG: ABC transporter substrate-binding protein [Limnothrix sp.]
MAKSTITRFVIDGVSFAFSEVFRQNHSDNVFGSSFQFMANKNDTAALLGALVLTVALLGAGGWWFLQQQDGSETMRSGGEKSRGGAAAIAERLSGGERLLLQGNTNDARDEGIAAYAAGDFGEAAKLFATARAEQGNRPDILIYLNNAKASQADYHTIAVVVPLAEDTETGIAEELLRGVAQAQEEVNQQGGINGKFLKVVIADDDDDAAIATDVAAKLSDDPDILGVVGHFSSDSSLAAGEIYQENGLVMISPTSTSVNLSGSGNYIFRTVPSDRFAGNALFDYLEKKLQVKNVAIFYNQASNYSTSLKDNLTTELLSQGGTVAIEVDVNQGGFNAFQTWNEAKTKNAEAIALLTNSGTLNQALQVMQVNENELPIVAGDSLYNADTLKIGGRDAVGMALAVPWHILSNPEAVFPQSSRRLWQGAEVNWRTAMAYDATQALITALQETPDISRETLQQTLANSSFSAIGAADPITFLPSGDRNQTVQIVEVEKSDRSGIGYDFVPVPIN